MIRVTEADKAAAKSVPIASLVTRTVQLDRRGFGRCPFHDDNTPSFHIHPKLNIFKCFGCGAVGDPIEWVRLTQSLDFAAAVQELLAGRPAVWPPCEPGKRLNPPIAPARRQSIPAYVRELWEGADQPTIAERYLVTRRVRVRPKPLPEAIRGHSAVWCAESKRDRPCVLAAVTDSTGEMTAVQRIWVDEVYQVDSGVVPPKGLRATNLRSPKKTIGPMRDGAVKLLEPSDMLGIAEGIETAMAVRQLYRVPCWAALGSRLGSITIPGEVKRVLIFGDNGTAGEAAAAAAVTAYRRRGLQCEAIFPKTGNDFCEELP